MENGLRKLLDAVDKAMASAEALKKATAGNDFAIYSSAMDAYTKSLKNMHLYAVTSSQETNELEVPIELLDIVSAGRRTDDYNLKVKESLEDSLKKVKGTAEAYAMLDNELENKYMIN
ncbi:hypothetical protein SteCoe_17801 [Stentor coeruleus]|uniref:Mediator of RNA polymerase II transcription subunit 10 n=1 Tax=Stentor coeruleus TaxID=5963 RepID=A0A1R2BY08_9CILI|nr:hypothetical protein SteCoe_17801 [Stentor coeruleus]